VTARGWLLIAAVAFLVGAFAPWDSLPWNQQSEGADPNECAYLIDTGQTDYALQMGCAE
jgi:hypothetical protein